MARALSPWIISGLIYLHKYRFLTISQFAKITGFSNYHSAEVLRDFERWGLVAYIGNIFLPGSGKTPKVYYLKRKGFELLQSESKTFEGEFTEVYKETVWSPAMYHRLKTIDLMLLLELAINKRPHLQIAHVFLEYRFIKRGAYTLRETADYVADEQVSENRLVPDSAFTIENIETERKALFFLETDLGTEPITSRTKNSIRFKLSQYDRYLQSMRFQNTYKAYGDFGAFIMCFVTTTGARIDTIRRQANPAATLARYYRLATFDAVQQDFCAAVWLSRDAQDEIRYGLVKE